MASVCIKRIGKLNYYIPPNTKSKAIKCIFYSLSDSNIPWRSKSLHLKKKRKRERVDERKVLVSHNQNYSIFCGNIKNMDHKLEVEWKFMLFGYVWASNEWSFCDRQKMADILIAMRIYSHIEIFYLLYSRTFMNRAYCCSATDE